MKKLLFLLCLIAQSVTAQQLQWHNPMDEADNPICGQAFRADLTGTYHRLPERVNPQPVKGKASSHAVGKGVWYNSLCSAGLTVRFRTNAQDISVRYGLKNHTTMNHMTTIGCAGMDLYATDNDGGLRWCAPMNPGYWGKDTVTFNWKNLSYIYRNDIQGYDYELYLPLYDEVTWMEIGVSEGAKFRFYAPTQEKPIIVYGTSIAQGACASRPGMAWTSILHRETQHPVVNLGFSGNGRLESELFDLMAETPSSLYIIDCMPNMLEEDLLKVIYQRTLDGVECLKKAHPETPILLVEHSGYCGERGSAELEERYRRTNRELLRAFRKLQADGVDGIYYLTKEEIGLTMDAMVEGVHPNDLGMRLNADACIKKVREIFHEDYSALFAPRPQNRDGYNWFDRHEEVIRLNLEEQPDIVLIGNSITHYWSGTPYSERGDGRDSWEDLFAGKKVRNMGFGWDRIENVLWRLNHGEMDGFQAKKIFLFMGTNNLETNTNDEIISGILQIVETLRRHQPKAEIYVCGIMPRDWQEPRVRNYNADLQRRLNPCDATFVDITSKLVKEDGTIIREYFRDGLHPNAEGYRHEAEMLRPFVEE